MIALGVTVESVTLAGAFTLGLSLGILLTLRTVRAVLSIFEREPRRSRTTTRIRRRRETP